MITVTITVITEDPYFYHFQCDVCDHQISSGSHRCMDEHMLDKHGVKQETPQPQKEIDLRAWYAKKGIEV